MSRNPVFLRKLHEDLNTGRWEFWMILLQLTHPTLKKCVFIFVVTGTIQGTGNVIWLKYSHGTSTFCQVTRSWCQTWRRCWVTGKCSHRRRGREIKESLDQDSQPRHWNGGLNREHTVHCLPNLTSPAYQSLKRISISYVWFTIISFYERRHIDVSWNRSFNLRKTYTKTGSWCRESIAARNNKLICPPYLPVFEICNISWFFRIILMHSSVIPLR
jgi:hypothetical protein